MMINFFYFLPLLPIIITTIVTFIFKKSLNNYINEAHLYKIKFISDKYIKSIYMLLIISCIFSISSIYFTKKNYKDVEKINKMISEISETHIYDIDKDVLINGALEGIIETTNDKYTRIITEESNILNTNVSDRITDINYIKIKNFNKGTADEFYKKYKRLEGKAVIIDLRDNSGGLLAEVVSVARLLLDKGIITKVEYKDKEVTYKIQEEKKDKRFFILLVNENTASAGEILTAALRDNNQATIIGNTTQGKGIGQTTKDLEDVQLNVTTFKWFTPKGININNKGINPDHEVFNKYLQLVKAIEIYNKKK